MSEWPLDEHAYREDDLYYASVATGAEVIVEDDEPAKDPDVPE